MYPLKSPKPVFLVKVCNQLNNAGITCTRKSVTDFLYSRGILVIVLILFLFLIIHGTLSRSATGSELGELPAQHGLQSNYITSTTSTDWDGICDLSTITDPTNLTTLVIMAYLNHDALMMVLSKYNDCRHFGGLLHEIVRYTSFPFVDLW